MKLPDKEITGDWDAAYAQFPYLLEAIVRDCAECCEQVSQNPKWAMTVYGKRMSSAILHRYGLEPWAV